MTDAQLRGLIVYHRTMVEVMEPGDGRDRHAEWVTEIESLRDNYREVVQAVHDLLADNSLGLLAHLDYQATYWGVGSRPGCDYARWAKELRTLREKANHHNQEET